MRLVQRPQLGVSIVTLVIIYFRLRFSLTKTIQRFGTIPYTQNEPLPLCGGVALPQC